MNKIVEIVQSKTFRLTVFIIGIIFTILSIFIRVNPEIFLQHKYIGTFIFSFFSSGIFLIPTVYGNMNFILFAFISSFAMSINESISWYVGNVGIDVLPHGKFVNKYIHMIQKYGVIGIFFFALIPFPFDTIGILAGYLKVPFWSFIFTVLIARIIRLLLVGYGIWEWIS